MFNFLRIVRYYFCAFVGILHTLELILTPGNSPNYVLKGVCHKIFWVLFWHVWIDLGLYKNL